MKKLLIIIPAFNEENNIEYVMGRLRKHYDYDCLVVNDGSKDNTLKKCIDNGYNYLDLPVNLGLRGAFHAGMKYAKRKGYDYAIQFDGDGQHNAEYISGMMKHAQEEKMDIVIGSRFVASYRPWSMRMLGSRLISICIWITTGRWISDPTSGMRLYNEKAINLMNEMNIFGPEPDAVAYAIRCGLKVGEYQVHMNERTSGESYLNMTNSIKYMARMVSSILIVNGMRGKK